MNAELRGNRSLVVPAHAPRSDVRRSPGRGGAAGGLRRFLCLLLPFLFLAACESFTGAAPPAASPAPSQWGEALFAGLGSTPEQVRAVIGEPTHKTVEGNRETWIYIHPDRPGWASNRVGTVTFLDGRVSKALMEALLTP